MYNGVRLMISDELEKTLQRTQKYAKSLKSSIHDFGTSFVSMLEDRMFKVMNACQIIQKN